MNMYNKCLSSFNAIPSSQPAFAFQPISYRHHGRLATIFGCSVGVHECAHLAFGQISQNGLTEMGENQNQFHSFQTDHISFQQFLGKFSEFGLFCLNVQLLIEPNLTETVANIVRLILQEPWATNPLEELHSNLQGKV
jgi:hypothetical protein